MGVVKRIQGWRDSRWPIPNTLQMLVGLIPYRDPEEFLERKRAAREAARSRAAMQTENPLLRAVAPRRIGPSVDTGAMTLDAMRAEVTHEKEEALAAMRVVLRAWFQGDLVEADPSNECPVRAAEGWYRVGRSFYAVGQGPFAVWSLSEPARATATHQGLLF
ncbi:MAG: hypothetical protein ACLQVD_08030 [Capsulimonadaceae bacterium]